MGKKMYYSEEEAAAKLGCSVDELNAFVTEEKIRVFKDGVRNMYNAQEVDALASEKGAGEEEDIVLTPADTGAGDEVEITLAAAGEETDIGMQDGTGERVIPVEPAGPPSDAVDLSIEAEDLSEGGKEDTALSEESVSIFDTSDFDVESADAMSKTQVAPSLEEQIAMEGVGSGSGLLDLTRESDDTSLGAEILEHIDADAEDAPELIEESLADDLSGLSEASAPAVVAPTVVEEVDPAAGLFGGMIVGCAVVALVLTAMALASLTNQQPEYLTWLNKNLFALVVGSIALVGIGALAGFMIGKTAAERQAAIRRAGG